MSLTNKFAVWLVWVCLGGGGNCLPKDEDYYTSLIGVQELAQQEQGIVSSLLNYRELVSKRLKLIDGYLKEYKDSLKPLTGAGSKYPGLSRNRGIIPVFREKQDLIEMADYVSSHPVLSFKLIRRLATQLQEVVDNFLNATIETDFMRMISTLEEKIRLPNADDVDGAVEGLLRIQATYAIPIDKFIRGKYGRTEVQLNSAFDLHYIGKKALHDKFLSYAVQWLFKAYQKILLGDTSISKDLVEKHLERAVTLHNENHLPGKEEESTHPFFFDKRLSSNISLLKVPRKVPRAGEEDKLINYEEDGWRDIWNFQGLCGGQDFLPPETRKELTCYYKRDSGLTFLAPMGVEVHSKSPLILQFYDILGDEIIAHMKRTAAPFLLRARIVGTPTDQNIKSGLRTSTMTWVKEGDDPTSRLKKIPHIIKDLTGLKAEGVGVAEDLQISSYGSIGGHYQPHFDSLFDDTIAPYISEWDKFTGDRMATIMFYLSDVVMGGGTAFPRVGVATQAVKGSAVFWYNLGEDGQRDVRSLHGGCPVAQGIKWGGCGCGSRFKRAIVRSNF